jgi:hypothetical protein
MSYMAQANHSAEWISSLSRPVDGDILPLSSVLYVPAPSVERRCEVAFRFWYVRLSKALLEVWYGVNGQADERLSTETGQGKGV